MRRKSERTKATTATPEKSTVTRRSSRRTRRSSTSQEPEEERHSEDEVTVNEKSDRASSSERDVEDKSPKRRRKINSATRNKSSDDFEPKPSRGRRRKLIKEEEEKQQCITEEKSSDAEDEVALKSLVKKQKQQTQVSIEEEASDDVQEVVQIVEDDQEEESKDSDNIKIVEVAEVLQEAEEDNREVEKSESPVQEENVIIELKSDSSRSQSPVIEEASKTKPDSPDTSSEPEFIPEEKIEETVIEEKVKDEINEGKQVDVQEEKVTIIDDSPQKGKDDDESLVKCLNVTTKLDDKSTAAETEVLEKEIHKETDETKSEKIADEKEEVVEESKKSDQVHKDAVKKDGNNKREMETDDVIIEKDKEVQVSSPKFRTKSKIDKLLDEKLSEEIKNIENNLSENKINKATIRRNKSPITITCESSERYTPKKQQKHSQSQDEEKRGLSNDEKMDDDGGHKRQPEAEQKNQKKGDERKSSALSTAVAATTTKTSPKSTSHKRKRRWLSRKLSESNPPILAITTDSLRNLISDVRPVPLSDVKLESTPEPEESKTPSIDEQDNEDLLNKLKYKERYNKQRTISENNNLENDNDDNENQNANKKYQPTTDGPVEATTATILSERKEFIMNRKISIINEDYEDKAATPQQQKLKQLNKVQRPPSPPKHSSSSVLYITNLVRPFTVLQLKGLLVRTGKIVENGFWIDKIKSRCYVKYSTEDEAIETRHALHGVRWPTSNPKCLNVDFGTENCIDKAIESTLDDSKKFHEMSTKDNVKEYGWGDSSKVVDNEEKGKDLSRPVREWDVGKKEGLDRDREQSRERERVSGMSGGNLSGDRGNRKRSQDRTFPRERRRSHSTSPARKFKKKEDDPPLRLLDDLFRKTKTTPCIYWLPLTAEQIAVKEEIRRQHMAEHQRRMEEIRKQEKEREREREKERERDRDKDRNNDRNRSNDRRGGGNSSRGNTGGNNAPSGSNAGGVGDRDRSRSREGGGRRYR